MALYNGLYGADQAAINAYNGGLQGASLGGSVEPPRTISSAIARIDGLYDRLVCLRSELSKVSEIIGGPRPLGTGAKSTSPAVPTGAVAKLNESADRCHEITLDIESAVSCIQRSLG
jgi:hypothetical protein